MLVNARRCENSLQAVSPASVVVMRGKPAAMWSDINLHPTAQTWASPFIDLFSHMPNNGRQGHQLCLLQTDEVRLGRANGLAGALERLAHHKVTHIHVL